MVCHKHTDNVYALLARLSTVKNGRVFASYAQGWTYTSTTATKSRTCLFTHLSFHVRH
nr:MAG TPA: hypothetical protein [Caudoviricetes sp.]